MAGRRRRERSDLDPCVCCGYLTVTGGPDSYDICAVCGWEQDLAQLRFATEGGGANEESLVEAQLRVLASPLPRAAARYERDSTWRPIDLAIDKIDVAEPGRDYGLTYAADFKTYYYWRRGVAD